MLVLMFLILARCAVKSDDTSNSYYVVEMPEDVSHRAVSRPFRVYWNVPTMQCKSKKIPFENLYEKYGIIQNEGDSFRGEKITILYDPGLFPALFNNESTGKFRYRNGGVPQEGDLSKHLAAFRMDLEKSIPDIDFNGIGIIDFESWRPIFRQNFGVLVPYKEISYENERKIHWWWPKGWIQEEARKNFEESAREFMINTIVVAKEMRPRAVWGYYGFPYCFNMASNNMAEDCSKEVQLENDKSSWLWAASSALFPSVYSSRGLTPTQLQALVRGRVREAARAKMAGARNVLPYFWFRYRDGDYFDQVDLDTALETMYHSKASGFIIWGSSNDVNTVEKCNNLLEYVQTTLGPAIAKYTKYQNRLGAIEEISDLYENTTTTDAIDDTETTNNDNDQKLELKPELNLLLLENNTKEINNINSESLDLALSNNTNSNESMLIDLVVNLHKNDEDGSNVRENNVVEVNYTNSQTFKTESTVREAVQTEFVTYESVTPSNRSTINNVETISSNIELDVTTEYIENSTNIEPNEYEYKDSKNKQKHKNNDDDFLTTMDEFLTVKPSIANGNNESIEFEITSTTESEGTTETEVEIEDLNRSVFDGSSNDSIAAPSASVATNHIGDQVVIYV